MPRMRHVPTLAPRPAAPPLRARRSGLSIARASLFTTALLGAACSSGGYDPIKNPDGYMRPPASATLSAIEPSSGPLRGGIPLRLRGSGFVPGIQVKFGTTAAPDARYVSPTELTTTLPASATAGRVVVSLIFPDGSETVRGDLFAYLSESVGFGSPSTYSLGNSPFTLAVGLIDADTLPDIAVSTSDSRIGLLISKGDGTFDKKSAPLGGGGLWQMAIVDVNKDGKPDLMAANGGANVVSLLLGKGDLTYELERSYTAGARPTGLYVADFDRDGSLDFAATGQNSNNLHIYLGRGDGVFTAKQMQPTGSSPLWIDGGDLNRDGIPDLVVANGAESSLSVFTGKGDGSFNAGVIVPTISTPVQHSVADLNGDGRLDVAAISGVQPVVGVLIGRGDGTFAPSATVQLGSSSGRGLQAADVNGDGVLDLVAACSDTGAVRVLVGRGDGTFQAEKVFATAGRALFAVGVGDWNRDTLADLVMTDGGNNDVSIMLQSATKP